MLLNFEGAFIGLGEFKTKEGKVIKTVKFLDNEGDSFEFAIMDNTVLKRLEKLSRFKEIRGILQLKRKGYKSYINFIDYIDEIVYGESK